MECRFEQGDKVLDSSGRVADRVQGLFRIAIH